MRSDGVDRANVSHSPVLTACTSSSCLDMRTGGFIIPFARGPEILLIIPGVIYDARFVRTSFSGPSLGIASDSY
jgi:hypothetical protein